MIGHELDRVPDHQRRILEAASAGGVEFSAAAVAAAERLGLDEVERDCDELARRASFLMSRGVETWPDGTVAGRYDFRHALHQESMSASRPGAAWSCTVGSARGSRPAWASGSWRSRPSWPCTSSGAATWVARSGIYAWPGRSPRSGARRAKRWTI